MSTIDSRIIYVLSNSYVRGNLSCFFNVNPDLLILIMLNTAVYIKEETEFSIGSISLLRTVRLKFT